MRNESPMTGARRAPLLLWALSCAMLAARPALAEARYRASVEIIIDKSESMALATGSGSLFRRTIEAARAATEGRADLPAGADLTWRVAGGGNPSDESACDATRLLVPAGISPVPIFAVAARERARGPRPLTAALEAAVADLPQDGRQHGLLIITSGPDTCGRDVCQTADDLRTSPGLGQVRVLLLGGDDKLAARLGCLGPVSRVSPEALTDRINEVIDGLADPAEVSVGASTDGQDVPARGELFAQTDAHPAVVLPPRGRAAVLPGLYEVHVVHAAEAGSEGAAPVEGWRRNIDIVADAHLVLHVPTGMQQAHLVASVQFNGQPAPSGTRVSVLPPGEAEGAVATGAPGEPLLVPGGRYDVRARIPDGPAGTVDVWKPEVIVKPGQTVNISLAAAQRRGTLEVDVLSGQHVMADATVTVVPAGAPASAGTTIPSGRDVPLAAGTYSIVARLDTAGGRLEAKGEVDVGPGVAAQQSLDLGATGWLTVSVAGHRPNDAIVVALLRSGEERPLSWIEAFGKYLVPAGTYDLRVEDKRVEPAQVYWHRGVEVRAGETAAVAMKRP